VTTVTATPGARIMPPVLGRLMSGTFWLALRTPLQAVFAFWSIRLILQAIGPDALGAYAFAWGFGFFQFLLEFGMSSALQRQVSETWTRGNRAGVDRAIACGMNFYAAMALVQAVALLAVAYIALPYTHFHDDSYRLIIKLLWLQVVTSPCYGMSTVVSSVLHAARRYDFMPRYELAIVVLRFLVLWAGLSLGVNFFLVVVMQAIVQVGLSLGPATWVMVRELGHVPHFRGASRADYAVLMHISFYMFLIQLSVVLADKIDTTILGFALPDPAQANAVYQVISKPFLQIRQTGWMLAYMVMPAVASLATARDERALDRIKYDGPRLHLGLILPIALLAWIYAEPFLTLWVGNRLGRDPASVAWLLRLFLVATIPLVITVQVQMAIGMNKIEVIALSALAGALINLPISYTLTLRLGSVAGVIWGTVLTTLLSNLLVPGLYVFRVLNIRPATYLVRTLSAPLAGAGALVTTTWLVRLAAPPALRGTTVLVRALPLLAHLTVGCLAYLAGYLAVPAGRTDLALLLRKLRRTPSLS
jgi:Na+-driven multidrug efflux pump